MNNFNLLVSTSRYNESNAEAELWFGLLTCGDEYPIISKSDFPGLVIALSNSEPKDVIQHLHKISEKDSNFFNYILKIVPIDFVCHTNVKIIKQLIKDSYLNHIKQDDSFRITLKRRKNEIINRDSFIRNIAGVVDNKVDLENPNITIRIEILGNICGIAFLKKGEILNLERKLPSINK